MEYTKDVVFNVQYGQDSKKIRLRDKKRKGALLKFYNKNKFIMYTLGLTIVFVSIDLCMVYNFINILTSI